LSRSRDYIHPKLRLSIPPAELIQIRRSWFVSYTSSFLLSIHSADPYIHMKRLDQPVYFDLTLTAGISIP